MRPTMEVFIEEGILRRVEATNKAAHRPSEIFQVNPHVLAEKDSSF